MSSRISILYNKNVGSHRSSKSVFSLKEIFHHNLRNNGTDKNISKPLENVKISSNKRTDKTFYSRLKHNGYFYITDPLSAESIALHISENWKGRYVFEVNPGLGVLSKAILNTGISHLRVFERNAEFLPVLQTLANHHSNLEIVEADFLSLPSLTTKSLHNESDELDILFKRIPEFPWNEDVPLRVFTIVFSQKSIKFFRFLLAALAGRASIFSLGRCEFFVLMTENEYKYMQAEPKENYTTYRWANVLYNLFFEIKFLDKFSSEIFFPFPVKHNPKKFQEQQFYLVKLTPKPDLFSSFVHENRLVEFYFFVRHHLAKRSSLVIPTMERWVPSCGPRLIKEGMIVFTKFGDLSPHQLVMLFNQFSSWPEYKTSTFHFALQQFHAKKGLAYEEESI